MPTYAYACGSCGFAKDEWLKVSEALPELACPSCGKPTYRKQLTAPAFQLKGGGWYVTDFRNGNSAPAKPADADKPTTATATATATGDSGASANTATAAATTPAPAAPSTSAGGS
jgi:putative FmdB family regulatory protein